MSTWSEKSAGLGHIMTATAMLIFAAALSAVEVRNADLPKGIGLFGGQSAADCPTRGGQSASLRPGCKTEAEQRGALGKLFIMRQD